MNSEREPTLLQLAIQPFEAGAEFGRGPALYRRVVEARLAIRQGAAVAERNGKTRFVSMQNMVNLLYREEERLMLPEAPVLQMTHEDDLPRA